MSRLHNDTIEPMQSVDDLRLDQEIKNQTKVRLYNPDKEDFTVLYHGKPVTIHAMEIEAYPFDIAQHLKKHLINHLMSLREVVYPTPEIINKTAKEVEVEV